MLHVTFLNIILSLVAGISVSLDLYPLVFLALLYLKINFHFPIDFVASCYKGETATCLPSPVAGIISSALVEQWSIPVYCCKGVSFDHEAPSQLDTIYLV